MPPLAITAVSTWANPRERLVLIMTVISIRKESANRYKCVVFHPNHNCCVPRMVKSLRKYGANVVALYDAYLKFAPILNESAFESALKQADRVYM